MVRTETLTLDGRKFNLRWDMNAIATVEGLTGENAFVGFSINVRTLRAVLWAAIDADAAHRGQDAPLTIRELGGLLSSDEEMAAALGVMQRLIGENSPDVTANPPKASGKRSPARAKRSRSGGATRSHGSTSA